MRIAVFGTGIVGQTIAGKLSELHHEIMIGTRDVKKTMKRSDPGTYGNPPFSEWLKKNEQVKLGTFAESAAFGEMVISAVNGTGTLQVFEQAGKTNLSDKIIIDISNPLDFSNGFPPSLFVCNTDSLAERLQKSHPNTKVVKTLNTMNAMIMVNPGLIKGDHNVFISGNDSDAKSVVREILSSFGWQDKQIIDLGDITTARGTEQILPLWVRLYGKFQSGMFNFHIARD